MTVTLVFRCLLVLVLLVALGAQVRLSAAEAEEGQAVKLPAVKEIEFLNRYCVECHSGKKPKAKLDLARFDSVDAIVADALEWDSILARIREEDMPPEDELLPSLDEREQFLNWVETSLTEAACSSGPQPGPAILRRLNKAEYSASIRDLLGIHWDAGEALPSEGAGGEGFDNAAETLFISPIHAEKFLESARVAVEYAFADSGSSRRFLIAKPGGDLTPAMAARRVLEKFLPRAFRRAVSDGEIDDYLAVFDASFKSNESYMLALGVTLRAVLVSPKFLFIAEEPAKTEEPELVTDYELAARMSYFLWGTMPDDTLLKLAGEGKLSDPIVRKEQFDRMMGREGSREVRSFAQNFVEQWLGTRVLGREFKPDKTIRGFDSELEGGMKYEPVFFLHEILTANRSLLDLIDSDYTYANNRLARHYGIRGSFREQPKRVELEEGHRRGGVLGMAAVLAISSYPHRTSPVLRGKWILETMLGDPPPPAPLGVPELEEGHEAETAKSLRERLEIHRKDPACAVCHDRIDPLGFGLENYGVLGRWRDEYDGHKVDARGTLPNGAAFNGPEELKKVLMERKDQFVLHFSRKMFGYALGRGLLYSDYCAIDKIVEDLGKNGYRSQDLLFGIIESVPFRYKMGTVQQKKGE